MHIEYFNLLLTDFLIYLIWFFQGKYIVFFISTIVVIRLGQIYLEDGAKAITKNWKKEKEKANKSCDIFYAEIESNVMM